MDGATVALPTIALVGTIAALAWLRATLIGDPAGKTLWLIFWLIPQIYIASVLLHGKCEPVVLIHLIGWWIFTTSTRSTSLTSTG